MLPIFGHQHEKNKENFQFTSSKHIDDDDDDAESSHSDCLIIEPDMPSRPIVTCNETNSSILSIGILPTNLPKESKLILIYENRTMDVRLLASVFDLENQQRLTIAHLNYFYSIPKRHLYLSNPCDIEHIVVARRSRIMYMSSTAKKYSLGFIGESPSIENHLRHLILFDDGSASYTNATDRIHLCLCQDFEQNFRLIESKIIRDNLQQILYREDLSKKIFQLNSYVCVKKFDDKYHNAQIIDIDCSIMKLKFYERQAQTEIWMHQQSTLITETIMSPVDLASPVILQNKRKYDQISTNSYLSTLQTSPHSTRHKAYEVHQCSPNCVLTAELNFDPTCINQNPYTLPFTCGWKYFHLDRYADGRFTKKPSTHRTVSTRPHYLYRSPCGRSFLTLNEVEDYLLETNSKLTIKYFIDDRVTHLQSSMNYDHAYILNQDISQGKEHVKISVYNEINSNLPEPFLYGTETRSKITFFNDTTAMTCCSCSDNCRDRLKCPCWLKTFEQAKSNDNEQISSWQRQNLSDEQMITRFGYIHQRLKHPVWSGIYECNSNCSCHPKQCTNRLVQNSLYQQLQLFYTESKGWALRVLHDVPHGSFINAYVGELITEDMATKRDFKYLAILDHKSHLYTNDNKKHKQAMKYCFNHVKIVGEESNRIPGKLCVRLSTDSQSNDEDDDDDDDPNNDDDDDACFILDAKYYGSISRFYNHSCKPNVQIQNVFINSHDSRFPVIALFACRNIRAGEEICWDYNYIVGCMPDVRIDCQCQASNCRGRLL